MNFVTLNRFCLLSINLPPPVQGWMEYQPRLNKKYMFQVLRRYFSEKLSDVATSFFSVKRGNFK